MGRITWNDQPKRNVPAGEEAEVAAHIGQRLNTARQKLQVSMRAVAAGTGLSNAFICQIENGQSIPSAYTLLRLARFFDVDTDYFFSGLTRFQQLEQSE